MKIQFIAFLLLYSFLSKAQYSISDIPKELLENANAVVRLDQANFEVLSVRNGKYVHKMVVTILNKKGNWHAQRTVSYDKLTKVVFTSANVYDAKGDRIYKLKKSDIIDQSSISGFSVYEDSRIKTC